MKANKMRLLIGGIMSQIYETCSSLTCPHAFSTRHGGVSGGVFKSLNLGCVNAEDVDNAVKN